MNFQVNVVLLSADTYRIPDPKTGEVTMEGLNVWYIADETLGFKTNEARDGNISEGFLPAQASFPVELKNKLNGVPGIYRFSMEMKTVKRKNDYGTKMAQSLIPTDLEFVGAIKMSVDKPHKA